MSQSHRLVNLPAELIQQVAGFACAHSVLRLTETCKSLRATCFQAVAFKEILLNRAPQWPEVGTVVLGVEKQIGLLDHQRWAEYAIMCEKADRLVELVEMYPFFNDTERCLSLHKALRDNKDSVERLGRNWLFAAAALNAKELDADTLANYRNYVLFDTAEVMRDQSCTFNIKGFESYENDAIIATIGVFAEAIKGRTEQEFCDRWAITREMPCPRPPRTYAMPLSLPEMGPDTTKTARVPIPKRFHELFTQSTAVADKRNQTPTPIDSEDLSWWLPGHITAATASEYLTSGEWCGYYSDGRDPGEPPEICLDPPMLGISFSASDNPANRLTHDYGVAHENLVRSGLEGDIILLHIKAKGHDLIGEFKLHGVLGKWGHIRMVKRYEDGPIWRWECCLTPFGIFGIWGEPGEPGMPDAPLDQWACMVMEAGLERWKA
ncbi:MAG: hypothetical protein M1831_006721 [Alyxoria varia]|nr:MAG: hypothetical protein M1831_006721 [Alyxoria varia]